MKHTIILFLFALLSHGLLAGDPVKTTMVRGVVTEQGTGELLSGVRIEVPGTEFFAYSDENGQFEMEVPFGAAKLEARFVSFERQWIELNAVNPSSDLTFSLMPL